MGTIFTLIAGICIGFCNLFMRRSVDKGGTSIAFLVIQLASACAITVVLNPMRTAQYDISTPEVVLGIGAGLILGTFMLCMGRAIENGPPGLTFTILNSAAVMPAMFMAVIFGHDYNYTYDITHALGSSLVVIALFWAGRHCHLSKKKDKSWRWIFFTAAAFVLNISLILFLQWRDLMLKASTPTSPLLPFHLNSHASQWFLPLMFFVATLVQLWVYFSKEKRLPKLGQSLYGLLGGAANGTGLFLVTKAIEHQKIWESAMLIPMYSVTIIVVCNLWAQLLYKESVNWKANALAITGLLIGTVRWELLF